MKRLSSVLVAFSISATISMFLGALILPAAVPSVMQKVAPYACPQGSEAVVFNVASESYRGRGVSTEVHCESSVAEWQRDKTGKAILWGLMFVPLFLLISIVQYVVWGPARDRESSFVSDVSPLGIAFFQGIWGLMSVGMIAGGLIYEHTTDPLNNPDLMFIDGNLSKGIDKIERAVGEPLHAGMVVVRIHGIELVRLFADEPEAAEDIYFAEGAVTRERKHKNTFGRRSFLVSEVSWGRIPSLVIRAIDAAELDSGRVSSVSVDREWSKEGVRIQVHLKGFEYKATVIFDQEGRQVSIDRQLHAGVEHSKFQLASPEESL